MIARDLIKYALFKIGVLGSNEQPSDADFQLGIISLRALLFSFISDLQDGTLTDVKVITPSYSANPYERILAPENTVINLPDKNSYLEDIRYGAHIQIIGESQKDYIYIKPKNYWLEVNAIDGNSSEILGASNDEALIYILAKKLASDFGVQLSQELYNEASIAHSRLSNLFTFIPKPYIDGYLLGQAHCRVYR